MTDNRIDNRIGGRIFFFPSLVSTNTTASDLAQKGSPEGDVVLADAQSGGRGRLDRTWQSPPGHNLYLSIILRPPVAVSDAPQITIAAGIAMAELLSSYCPGRVALKWPNDVLIGDKKACGILTEMNASATGVAFVILGIGINVNMTGEVFDLSLRESATSLRIETGQVMDRLAVAEGLFESVEKWYRLFLREGFRGLKTPFLSYARLVGRPIRVVFKNDVETGVAVGIDDDGMILMEDRKGDVRRISAGDVHIMKG